MSTITRSDVLKLSLDERIKLVEDIWDSIAECPDAVVLTDEQKVELENRLDAYHLNPELGSPWKLVRDRIMNYK